MIKNHAEFESFLGAILVTFVCLTVIFTSIMLISGTLREDEPALFVITIALMAVLDTWLLVQVWRYTIKKSHPVPCSVALSQPNVHIIINIPVGLLWLIHILLCVILFIGTFEITKSEDQFTGEFITKYTFQYLFATGLVYASYIYILLSAYSLTRRKNIVEWLWRKRWIVSLSAGAVSILISWVR